MDLRVAETHREVRAECSRDYVDLCTIPGWMPDSLRQSEECIPLSMQIVDALLGDPAIIVGQFRERRFEPWEIPATEASARIRREWEALGRRVNLGDIRWFTERAFHQKRNPSNQSLEPTAGRSDA